MKLSTGQWLWMGAATLVIATLLLDIANVLNVPPIYWMLSCGLLTVIGWWVMPSIKELSKAQRRRS